MELDELKKNLDYLVDKYIDDEDKKKELKEFLLQSDRPGAKGILHEINQSGKKVEPGDSELIQEIVYHYV